MPRADTTYEQLFTAFRHGQFEPLYLLHGEEKFLMQELQDLLIEKALAPHEHDFNLDILYGSECDVRQVLATCAGFPMMAERRVVIVREFDKLSENRTFSAYAERPNSASVVLLVCSGKPNFSTHPYRALRQHAVTCEFKPLDARRLPRWIETRIRGFGREIEPRALQMLSDTVGSDLATASTEIDKLLTYAGERSKLTEDDVLRAGGQSREYNVFELQRKVGERRHEEALRIAERLLQQSTNPRGEAIRMLSILGMFFIRLWKVAGARSRGVTEAEMAKVADIRPYFLREYVHALRNWSGAQIDTAFSALLSADYELKGGSSRDERVIITLMLNRMMVTGALRRAA